MTPSLTEGKLNVFISSTMIELRDVRDIVQKTLHDRGINALIHESYAGARPESIVKTSLSQVKDADIYLGLFWKLYGAITVEEYSYARSLKKPCFVYIRDKHCHREEILENFLKSEVYDVRKGVTYSYFESAVKLGEQIADDITAWLLRTRLQEASFSQQTFPYSRKLVEYNKMIIKQLKGDWFDRFINLHIMPMNLRTAQGSASEGEYTIFEIADKFAQSPIAILGEPGAGKTTLMKMLAIHYMETGLRIPVFVDMAKYSADPDFDILGLLRRTIDPVTLKVLLDIGRLLVIFDGLNEVFIELRENAVRTVANFVDSHPNNQYFITCRTAEYPTFLRTEVRRFEVSRIDLEEVQNYLKKVLGSDLGVHIYRGISPVIKDLCRTPLLLTMLTYLYSGNEKLFKIPTSKVVLYEQFLSQLYLREEDLRSVELPSTVHDDFLIHLAKNMNNKQVFVKRGAAETWVKDLYRSRYLGWGLNITTILHEVLELPPLKSSKPGHQPDVDIGFIHQTFQEYYTARSILLRLTQGDLEMNEVALYSSLDNKHWWETLTLLVGMMDDATELIRKIKESADSLGDRDMLRLVADCVCEAKYVDTIEVDDVIIRIILAFKFGKIAFDYDLIESLKQIKPEQRSSNFPTRLIEDVNWWTNKYAKETAVNLGNNVSIKTLLSYLDSEQDSLVLDTLFTLRNHKYRQMASTKLVELLNCSKGTLREQIIITLGYLEADATLAVDLLIDVVNNPEETKWARVHALAALSKIGDTKAFPAMVSYVLDHRNPYRDSAFWAFLGIAKKNIEDSLLQEQMKSTLMKALLTEANTEEGRYAKGNIVYALGELDAKEYVEDIMNWLAGEKEPYVVEDGIRTLGVLGNARALSFVQKYLSNEDFLVQMTAVDALASIMERVNENENEKVLSDLQSLLNDNAAIVREHTSKAIDKIQKNLCKGGRDGDA